MLVVRDGLWKGPSKMDVHVRPVWQAAAAAASVGAREALFARRRLSPGHARSTSALSSCIPYTHTRTLGPSAMLSLSLTQTTALAR